MEGDTILVIIIIVAGLLAVFGFAQMVSNKGKKTSIQQKIEQLPDFRPTHIVVKVGITDAVPTGIAIDDDSKKMCLIEGDSMQIIGFNDLIEAEVLLGGKTVTKTSRANQFLGTAVGALIAGGVGAVIGGLSSKQTTTQDIKEVLLKLIINNTKRPVHIVNFIELVSTGSTLPDIAIKEAQSWHDLLSVIIRQANDLNATNTSVNELERASTADELERIVELHKSGALSDDEFKLAKTKLLE